MFEGLTVKDPNTKIVYGVKCIEEGLFLRRAIDTHDPVLIKSIVTAKAVTRKGLRCKELYRDYLAGHPGVKTWRLDQTVRYLDDALPIKFAKCEEYRREVVASQDLYIVEATNDPVWGAKAGGSTYVAQVQLEAEKKDIKGQNLMGRIHIDHRPSFLESLRKQGPPPPSPPQGPQPPPPPPLPVPTFKPTQYESEGDYPPLESQPTGISQGATPLQVDEPPTRPLNPKMRVRLGSQVIQPQSAPASSSIAAAATDTQQPVTTGVSDSSPPLRNSLASCEVGRRQEGEIGNPDGDNRMVVDTQGSTTDVKQVDDSQYSSNVSDEVKVCSNCEHQFCCPYCHPQGTGGPPNDFDNPSGDAAMNAEPAPTDESNPCGLTDKRLAFVREAPVEDVAQAVVDGLLQVFEFTKTLGKCTRGNQISRRVRALKKQQEKNAGTPPAPKYRVLSERMYWVKKLVCQNHMWNIHESWEGVDNGVKANGYDTTITDAHDCVVEWIMKEDVEGTVSKRLGVDH